MSPLWGIDLGGTKIEAIAIDRDGQVVSRDRLPTPRNDYDAVRNVIAGLVTQAEQEIGDAASVGIGMPGSVSRT